MATKCPKCDFENPDTQKFCGDCGTQLTPSESIPDAVKPEDREPLIIKA